MVGLGGQGRGGQMAGCILIIFSPTQQVFPCLLLLFAEIYGLSVTKATAIYLLYTSGWASLSLKGKDKALKEDTPTL